MKARCTLFLLAILLLASHEAHAAFRYSAWPLTDTTSVVDSPVNKNKAYERAWKEDDDHMRQHRAARHHLPGKDDGRNGVWSFVFGLAGLFFSPLGIVAIILGPKGWRREQPHHTLAVIGFILGILEVLEMIALLILIVF